MGEILIDVDSYGELGTIIAHYKALHILIDFVVEHGGHKCLAEWDRQRNKIPEDFRISIKVVN